MEKCFKCFTPCEDLVKYTDLKNTWLLCHICNMAYDCKVTLMNEFLKEDFGKFPVPQATKNMINARKRRALDGGPWKKSCEALN